MSVSLTDMITTHMEPSSNSQSTNHDNLVAQKLSSTNKQSSGPVNFRAYPLQSVPMEPPPDYLGPQQLSPTIRQPSLTVQTSVPTNTGPQLLSTNKRPPQMEASPKFRTTLPYNPGPQQMSANKRPHMEPPLKGQTESIESVRSKLRESLASALGMASPQQSKVQVVKKTSIQTLASNSSDTGSNEDSVKDEFLQGHGLCWASDIDGVCSEATQNPNLKRFKLEQEEITEEIKDIAFLHAENLATQIESELFRLFSGVNKKYKEKGRSLLFNLKDRNNPELRERVVSGEIAPERLCSMTAEELASKELSEWRLAKAEEYAHMVVLQDSDVDIRRLVRKTHKGEFQVEVEQDDNVSVEVGLSAGVLSQVPRKANEEAQSQSKSKSSETKTPQGKQSENDLIQEFMGDEVKETEFLPSIVSLDEFMEALDNEPPFEILPMNTERDIPSSAEKNSNILDREMNPASQVSEFEMCHVPVVVGTSSDPAMESSGFLPPKVEFSDTIEGKPVDISPYKISKLDEKYASTDSNLKSASVHGQPDTYLADVAAKSEYIWEGIVQLNISALATLVGFFRSGEKTSTREWSGFLEIKGRVRLDAFEKFLQELPLSRSRAIMITQFSWKQGSPEVGRLHLCETVNTYVADERVGFAEPAPGVELYFCPPHPKTTEILTRNLPKEHTSGLHWALDGHLIGVVVWRRPVSESPRVSSHHKHKKQSSSRKHDLNPGPTPVPCPTNPPPPVEDDEPIDDVPPGFGPREDDDLPEFNFVNSRNTMTHPSQGLGMCGSCPPAPPVGHPTEQMRELIHKYGQSENARKPPSLEIEPWNDDDDIPEWQPHSQAHPHPLPGLPPLPPPPPPQHYPQQTQHQFMMNQQFVPPQQHMLLPLAPPQQLMPFAMPMPIPLQPPMGMMPPGLPGWQPPPWLPQAPRGVTEMGLQFSGSMQPCHFVGQPGEGGQFSGPVPPMQNGMGWRPDMARGFR